MLRPSGRGSDALPVEGAASPAQGWAAPLGSRHRHFHPSRAVFFAAAQVALVLRTVVRGSLEVDQQLIFRPVPELSRYRTPLRGLYLASTSVHPGPGGHGVCGAGAARAVQAGVSSVRPWCRPR
jgi:hypothetical protein